LLGFKPDLDAAGFLAAAGVLESAPEEPEQPDAGVDPPALVPGLAVGEATFLVSV